MIYKIGFDMMFIDTRFQNTVDTTNTSFWDNRRQSQILVMSLTFLVSWTPFGWLYMTKMLGIKSKDTQTGTDMIALLCVKFGCAIINPLVHVFENSKVMRCTNCVL